MKNNTEIISDMPEEHELVTQVSFKRLVLPARRVAALCTIRYRQRPARQCRNRSGNSGLHRAPSPRCAPTASAGQRRPAVPLLRTWLCFSDSHHGCRAHRSQKSAVISSCATSSSRTVSADSSLGAMEKTTWVSTLLSNAPQAC